MKKLLSYMIVTIVLAGSFNLSAQENSALNTVVVEYAEIKEALVADDFAGVKKQVPDLKQALADASIENEDQGELVEAIDALAVAADIQSQRKAFAALSQFLVEVVKEQDLDQTIYVKACPMALNGQGATWLSLEEQVQNPYMGQRMPRCGSVKEKI